jgi:hypothetical protein
MKKVYLIGALFFVAETCLGMLPGNERATLISARNQIATIAETEVAVTIDQQSPVIGC